MASEGEHQWTNGYERIAVLHDKMATDRFYNMERKAAAYDTDKA
jgi:hypothetical protein